MPVTFNKTVGKSTAADWSLKDKMYLKKAIIDTQDITGIVSTDIIQALGIAAGTYVLKVGVRIIRPCVGTSGSATIGDGDSATGWDTTINLKAAAGTITTCGSLLLEAAPPTFADTNVLGKIYAAADTIDATVTLHADLTDKGSFEIFAICCDIL